MDLWSGERDSNPRSRALKAPQNASPVTTAYGCSGGSRTLFILDYETNELSEALPSYKTFLYIRRFKKVTNFFRIILFQFLTAFLFLPQ